MPRLLETVTLGEIAAVAVLLVAVGTFLRKAVPVLRKVSRLADLFLGVPETVPGRGDGSPGVLDRLTRVEAGLGEVREIAQAAAEHSATAARELLPNGGSSARDAIDDIRAKIDQTQE